MKRFDLGSALGGPASWVGSVCIMLHAGGSSSSAGVNGADWMGKKKNKKPPQQIRTTGAKEDKKSAKPNTIEAEDAADRG